MKDYKESIEELDELFKSKKMYPSILLAEAAGTIGLLLTPINYMFNILPVSIFPTILYLLGSEYSHISKYVKGDRVIEGNIEFCNELMREYNEYIYKIVSLLIEYKDEYEDELVLAYTLYYLLSWGCFSQNNEYKYHVHRILDCIGIEFEGMYVIEGNCCCRHNTAFISDLLYCVGFDTIDISTSMSRLDKDVPVHSICGIINKKSFAFDFTHGEPYSIDYSNKELYFPGNRITNKKPATQYYINHYKGLCTNITDDMISNSRELTIELVEYCDEKGYNLATKIAKAMKEIESKELNPLKQDIAAKSLKLMPRRF